MNRPYQTPVEKLSFKEEVESIRSAALLRMEAAKIAANKKWEENQEKERIETLEKLYKNMASLEENIKAAASCGHNVYTLSISKSDIKYKVLYWFPRTTGNAAIVFNKFVELGFSPQIEVYTDSASLTIKL